MEREYELQMIKNEGQNAAVDGWEGPCPYELASPEAFAWNKGYLKTVEHRLFMGFDAMPRKR